MHGRHHYPFQVLNAIPNISFLNLHQQSVLECHIAFMDINVFLNVWSGWKTQFDVVWCVEGEKEGETGRWSVSEGSLYRRRCGLLKLDKFDHRSFNPTVLRRTSTTGNRIYWWSDLFLGPWMHRQRSFWIYLLIQSHGDKTNGQHCTSSAAARKDGPNIVSGILLSFRNCGWR